MADDELVQMAERALADAEAAYRADPSEANQRRIQSAWSFVQRARQGAAGERTTPGDRASRDAAGMTGQRAPDAVLALVDAVLVDLAVRRTMYVGRRGEDGDDTTFVVQTGEDGRARLRLPELSSDDSIERMIVDVQMHLGEVFWRTGPALSTTRSRARWHLQRWSDHVALPRRRVVMPAGRVRRADLASDGRREPGPDPLATLGTARNIPRRAEHQRRAVGRSAHR